MKYNMENKDFYSPLFIKYKKIYDQNKKSQVFAPLAELYRRKGLLDKSIKLLSKGLQFHPQYLLGHIIVARCYLDLKNFNLAHKTLQPYAKKARFNLQFQKIYAVSTYEEGHYKESLAAYKTILFLDPKNMYIKDKMKDLKDLIDHSPQNIFSRTAFSEEKLALGPYKVDRENVQNWQEQKLIPPPKRESKKKISYLENTPTVKKTSKQMVSKNYKDDRYNGKSDKLFLCSSAREQIIMRLYLFEKLIKERSKQYQHS